MRVFWCLSIAATLAAQDPRSEDPKERAKAAKEAIKAGPQGITRITPLLSDSEVSVRVEAVKSIVEIGSQYSLDPLRRALADSDSEVRIRATDGLVNFYLPGYVRTGLSGTLKRTGDAVIGRFRTETEDRAIEPWIDVRPEIISALAKVLRESQDISVRANVARALGVLRGRAALDDLHAALRTKDTSLMYESLVAIEKIRDPRSGPAVRFLFRDPEERIAAAALDTAGLVRSTETLPDIETVYNRTSSSRVKRAALGAMAAIADPRSRTFFAAALQDKDEYIRAAAVEGLGRLKNAGDVPTLETVFNDERKMPPRLAAAFGLVNSGRVDTSETSALTYLINTLNSKSWGGVAEGFLVELARVKKVRTALERAVPDATKSEKVALSRILGASGDKDSAVALQTLTRDSEPEVMDSAIRALKNLRARTP